MSQVGYGHVSSNSVGFAGTNGNSLSMLLVSSLEIFSAKVMDFLRTSVKDGGRKEVPLPMDPAVASQYLDAWSFT
jgi:hypothetical protein